MIRPPQAARTLTAAALLLLAPTACNTARGPYSPLTESRRDTARAQALTQQAAAILHKDPARAERLLRDALNADLYHGPAHNNLGVLFLSQDKLYESASEFEWARKLMPGHPDPRINLALVLERAGRTDDALAAYSSALEVHPNHLPAMQGRARLQVRTGRADAHTPGYLDEIALRGETEQWRHWARMHLLKHPPPAPRDGSTPAPPTTEPTPG